MTYRMDILSKIFKTNNTNYMEAKHRVRRENEEEKI